MRQRLSIIISIFLILFMAYGSAYAESVLYYADATAADQGVAGTRTIKGLMTAIGATKEATIVLAHNSSGTNTTYTLSTDLTISSNISLRIDRGAVVAIATGKTLTFAKDPAAGDYKIITLTGTGKVSGLKKSNPIWFGAKIDFNGTTGTDDAAAWQSALDSIDSTGGELVWPVGASYVASTLIWPNNGTYGYAIRMVGSSPAPFSAATTGPSRGVSVINFGGTGYLFDMRNGDSSNLIWYGSIENGHLFGGDTPDTATGYGTLTATQSGLNIYRMNHASLKNLGIKAFGIYGIHSASYIYYSIIDNVKCYYNGIGWYGESAQVNGTTIFRSAFSQSGTTGLAFSTIAGHAININGSWFEGNGQYGVSLTDPIQVNVTGSYFENNVSSDIRVTAAENYNAVVNLYGTLFYQTTASHYAGQFTGIAVLNSIGCNYDKAYDSGTGYVFSFTNTIPRGSMIGNAFPKTTSGSPMAASVKANFIWNDNQNPGMTLGSTPSTSSTVIPDGSIVFNNNPDTYGGLLGWQFYEPGAGSAKSLSGITATTTAASAAVTVNSLTGLEVGTAIEIAGETFGSGAASFATVTQIRDATTIYVDSVAQTGVSDAAVSYHTAAYRSIKGLIYDKIVSSSSSSGTGEDTLATVTIPAGMMTTTSGFKVTAAGTKTGANGNKTIKFYFGANAITVFPATNNVLDWQFEAQVFNYGGVTTAQIVVWKFTSTNDVAGASTVYGGVNGISTTTANAVTMKLTGECAHADDVITLGLWLVEPM